ncbi:MAG: hypothetical protein EPN50_09875 [Chloroflexota bacterium]|nr:MAG: hypothetical protein EPN50_09875 [Chloroflexota bacterium]
MAAVVEEVEEVADGQVAEGRSARPTRVRRSARVRTPLRWAVNIGPGLARDLTAVGVADLEALTVLGAVAAWRRLRLSGSRAASLRDLYALEGAIRGVRGTMLEEGVKARLREAAR